MAKNSLSLSLVLMNRVAEVFQMWILGACFRLTILWEAAVFVYIIIYVCLDTFNFKAAVRVVSWQTALQCSGHSSS